MVCDMCGAELSGVFYKILVIKKDAEERFVNDIKKICYNCIMRKSLAVYLDGNYMAKNASWDIHIVKSVTPRKKVG